MFNQSFSKSHTEAPLGSRAQRSNSSASAAAELGARWSWQGPTRTGPATMAGVPQRLEKCYTFQGWSNFPRVSKSFQVFYLFLFLFWQSKNPAIFSGYVM